jgi:hypothetical protein
MIETEISCTLKRSHDESRSDLVRESIGAGRASRLDVKLLQHLNRQGIVAALDECHCPITLRGLSRIPTDGVEKDVRVEKAHSGLFPAAVHVIARYAVTSPESANAFP